MSPAGTGFGAIEVKAFVPARDFALSRRFYEELGFEIPWSDETLAYMRLGDTAFFLQNFYVAEHASNFMMHLTVQDVDGWWARLQQADIAGRYGVRTVPPQDQPWRQRDFVLTDPSGVLWRIAQNMP
ncbi:VOC family protein [Polaromonas aquatica]|uniref:VOC family protein n=1 Tax=Polaromonas aquatica TaxID=332657 RepID=UPI003D649204